MFSSKEFFIFIPNVLKLCNVKNGRSVERNDFYENILLLMLPLRYIIKKIKIARSHLFTIKTQDDSNIEAN